MRTGWLTFHDRKWLSLKRPLTGAGEIEEKFVNGVDYAAIALAFDAPAFFL